MRLVFNLVVGCPGGRVGRRCRLASGSYRPFAIGSSPPGLITHLLWQLGFRPGPASSSATPRRAKLSRRPRGFQLQSCIAPPAKTHVSIIAKCNGLHQLTSENVSKTTKFFDQKPKPGKRPPKPQTNPQVKALKNQTNQQKHPSTRQNLKPVLPPGPYASRAAKPDRGGTPPAPSGNTDAAVLPPENNCTPRAKGFSRRAAKDRRAACASPCVLTA